jgi:DNA-binding CsgD family transcriptional regulator
LERVLKLLLDLYHGARERPLDEFQDFALELVKPAFDFESARWGNASIDRGSFVPFALHRHNDPEESVADWAEFIKIDTFATEAATNPGRATAAHFPSRYTGPGTTGIREYAHKYGHENALALGLQTPENHMLNWIALYRADPDHHFSEREQRLAEGLLPHLLQAFGINRSIWLDRIGESHGPRRPSFAMTDRRGMLWFAEPDFTRLISAEFPAWREPALPKLLAAKLSGEGRFVGTELAIAATPLGKLLLLKAREVSPIDRLTRRERDVALAFGRGYSTKEVADQLGISANTVHHHLRVSYDKLGIDNKAALAMLVAGLDS